MATPRISIVVAASGNNVIGVDGRLPWRLPEDLRHFKAVTMGKPVIMGRPTHETIGKALPGRQNIVITRQSDYAADGCDVVGSPDAALEAAGNVDEVMVIGGGEIYREFLHRTDRIYLTRVQGDVEGDTTFPELDLSEWNVVSVDEYPAGEDREIGFDIETLDRAT